VRPLLPLPPRRRKRPRLLTIQVLPTLVTLGNVLAGVLALSYLIDAWGASGDARGRLWAQAAIAILAGMVCDALDGRVARLTGAASSFGAELDSLADVVTFGVAPALLAKSIAQASLPDLSPRVATMLVIVYTIGAALRLARYNVESNRVAEPGHETRVFRGLPSPGAAGVLATLALLHVDYGFESIAIALLASAPLCGVLMVSRLAYPHVVNRWLTAAQSPVAILLLLVSVFVGIHYPALSLGTLFIGYALSGPVIWGVKLLLGRPRWADEEDEDEVVLPEVDVPAREAGALEGEGDATDRPPGAAAR
jgi:CDP-diacylglycerol---serine O-phosphatidyltransferase